MKEAKQGVGQPTHRTVHRELSAGAGRGSPYSGKGEENGTGSAILVGDIVSTISYVGNVHKMPG